MFQKNSTMIYPISEKNVVINENAKGPWCRLPYPNHPQGCPNYGKRKTCPPVAKKFGDLIEPPLYLAIQQFNLEFHKKKMKEKHPNWTDKQCRNLLYWQKGVIKRLKDESYQFARTLGDNFIVLDVPEANGVQVFETCKKIGILLDKNPEKIVYKIMIIGKNKEK